MCEAVPLFALCPPFQWSQWLIVRTTRNVSNYDVP